MGNVCSKPEATKVGALVPVDPKEEDDDMTAPTPTQFALENKDILMNIFSFLGLGQYTYIAGVSTKFKEYYLDYFNTLKEEDIPDARFLDRKAIATDTFYSAAFSNLACAKFWYKDTWGHRWCYKQEDQTVSVKVAKYGTVQVMEWVRRQGFPWSSDTSKAAAQFGHLKMLRYLHKNGCPWDSHTAHEAAYNGHLSCLRYAHENGCYWYEYTARQAAQGGSLNCLQYAHQNGCPWDENTIFQAISYGRLECLQYALQNNCPSICSRRGILACTWASYKGKLDCLRLAHQYGSPWNEETCFTAAGLGHLDCLLYAHQNGCPWDSGTCWLALQYGRLHCFNYAIQNDCPCPDRVYEVAGDAGAIIVQERGRRYLVLPEQEEEIQQLAQRHGGLGAFHQALLVPPSRESRDWISQAVIELL